MKVQLVPSNQEKAIRIIAIPDDMTLQLEDLQRLVGGYVEMVNTPTLGFKKHCMLVDEEGRIKGRPRNIRAEQISGYAGILVGDAVVCGLTSQGGELTWSDYEEPVTASQK
jgi:hypothetical protein